MDIGKIVFEEFNQWVYNDENQAGDKIIDASDLPEIIQNVVKKYNDIHNVVGQSEQLPICKCENTERQDYGQGTLLEEASFKFSQDSNCLDDRDEYESLEIEAQSSLGIDRDNHCFFVLKTEKWSVDGVEDLEKLFNRIRKIVINHGKK
jgi:hypothetical protein